MEVSVIVIVYNEQGFIKKCLSSILNQTFIDFELLVIDDNSTDNSAYIINSIHDKRICYIRNDKNYGRTRSRNIGLKNATGKYIFFTDSDCAPIKYWLEEGLKIFKQKGCVGVRGITFYATARTTIADRIIEDPLSRYYGTNNIAYTKEVLDKVCGFNQAYNSAHEDLDIALRIMKYGGIIFTEDMVVIHKQTKVTIENLFRNAKSAADTVLLIKNHPNYHDNNTIWHKVIYPKKFFIVLFPFLLIPYHSFRSWKDFVLLPFIYLSAIYLRLIIWKTAIKEKIFLI